RDCPVRISILSFGACRGSGRCIFKKSHKKGPFLLKTGLNPAAFVVDKFTSCSFRYSYKHSLVQNVAKGGGGGGIFYPNWALEGARRMDDPGFPNKNSVRHARVILRKCRKNQGSSGAASRWL